MSGLKEMSELERKMKGAVENARYVSETCLSRAFYLRLLLTKI